MNTMSVTMGQSSIAKISQPTITIDFPESTHHRERSAETYRLAAQIEEASKGERWVVVPSPVVGTVHLELFRGSQDEAERGLAVLRKVAG